MNKTKGLLLAAGIVLAMAFTFSGCKEEAKDKPSAAVAETDAVALEKLQKKGDVYYLNNVPYTGKVREVCDEYGECSSEYEMKNGKLHGEYQKWSGPEFLLKGNYKDGKKHGEWHESDRGYTFYQHYKDGKKHGEWRYFDHETNDGGEAVNSRLIKTETWENDKLIKTVEIEGTFTDSRDGKKYKTVKIGEQVWMAENLNYEAKGSKCFSDDPNNCVEYGRLYNWETAKKACPAGWHLPSDDEWTELVNAVGGSETAGNKLKAIYYWWHKGGGGTNEYGFAAKPGGLGHPSGSSVNAGSYGNWWSATARTDDHASYWGMDNNSSSVDTYGTDMGMLLSVRCVQDKRETFTDSRDGKKLPSLKPSETGEFASEDPVRENTYGFHADPNGKYYHFMSHVGDGDSQWDGLSSYSEKFTATSTLAPQGKVNYSAENLQNNTNVGGIRSTTWCDGVKGYGTGERVTMSIRTQAEYSDVVSFYKLLIVNGYANTAATWKKNTRVKTLRLYVGGKAWCDLQLSDIMKPQIFTLPENLLIVPAKSGKVVSKGSKFPAYQTDLTFEIVEVYPGDKYDDTCITGIALDILTSGVY